MAPSAISKFSNYAASQGRPDLAELLPTEEGAPVEIVLSASDSSRLLDEEDAEVIAEGSKDAGLWVEKVALPHHSVGDAGAAHLAKLSMCKALDLLSLIHI